MLHCGKAVAAQVSADKSLAEWVTWFPEGKTQLEDGPEYWVTSESWRLIKSNIDRRGLELVVDYEHQTLNSEENGHPAPAAGWCKEWRYMPGVGIQARVEWTAKAAEYLKNGEYRYFSPVFSLATDSAGRKVLSKVHNVALTNDPRTNNLKAIAAKLAAGESGMDIKQIAALLGMADTATPEEVMAAIGKLREMVAGVEAAKTAESKKTAADDGSEEHIPAKLLAALDLQPGAKADLVVAKIKAMQGAGSQVADLTARLVDMEAQAKAAKTKELMTSYAAKLTPAMRKDVRADGKPYWEALAEEQPEVFVHVAKNLPDAVPVPLSGKKDQAGNVQLTPEDKIYCAKFGVDEKEYLKTKQEAFHG